MEESEKYATHNIELEYLLKHLLSKMTGFLKTTGAKNPRLS